MYQPNQQSTLMRTRNLLEKYMVRIDQNKYIARTKVVSFDSSFPGFEWAGGAETRFSWTFFRFCFLACCWGGVLVAPRPLATLELLGPGLT